MNEIQKADAVVTSVFHSKLKRISTISAFQEWFNSLEEELKEKLMTPFLQLDYYEFLDAATDSDSTLFYTMKKYITQANKICYLIHQGNKFYGFFSYIQRSTPEGDIITRNVTLFRFNNVKGDRTLVEEIYALLEKLLQESTEVRWECKEGNPALEEFERIKKEYRGISEKKGDYWNFSIPGKLNRTQIDNYKLWKLKENEKGIRIMKDQQEPNSINI
jgi:hypothetical protein